MRLLLIGIIFIVGGASGEMALRGTGSGLALAVVGVGLCIWGGIQMKNSSSSKQMPRRSALRGRPKPRVGRVGDAARPGAVPGRKLPPTRPGAGAR